MTSTSARTAARRRSRGHVFGRFDRRARRRPAARRRSSARRRASTSAPRRHAAAASATPILPLLWFEMNRTGSIASRVGPAVTSTRLPASDRARLEQSADVREDRFRLRHAPRTVALARREIAFVRVRRCGSRVCAGGSTLCSSARAPTCDRSSRVRAARGSCGEKNRGQQVVRLSGRRAREKIRRGGRDDQSPSRCERARCGPARAPARTAPRAPAAR